MRIDPKYNRRILVVDDDEAVRDSFRLVLCPPRAGNDQIAAAAAALFDDLPKEESNSPAADAEFQVDFATNGREALDRVNAAIGQNQPYAAVFCDMRMPGWDGLETIEHVRKVDPRCEIVFVTAYSDQDVESVIRSVGGDIGYFLKPFANEELRQMATKAVLDWNRARELEKLLRTVTSLRGETEDIDRLLQYLLSQLCDWLGTGSAALVQLSETGDPSLRLAVGSIADENFSDESIRNMVERCRDDPCHLEDGSAYLSIREYGLAIAVGCDMQMTPDKEYLLRFFLEHASVAIRNSEMQSQLVKAEQLAAVGQAVGFIVHDLRGPLGNIQDLVSVYDQPEEFGMTQSEVKELLDESIDTTMQLMNDILEFTRGTTKVDPVAGSWSELISRKLELVRLDLRKQQVELIVEAADDLALFLDANRIFRVIRNLCKNAGEALRQTGRTDGRVTVGAQRQNGVTRIRVADNGSGLPPEVQDKLFQPFATKGKIGGTGFGLAIAKQLVEAHDGTIAVDTGPSGTTFTISIPDAEDAD